MLPKRCSLRDIVVICEVENIWEMTNFVRYSNGKYFDRRVNVVYILLLSAEDCYIQV